VVLLVVSWTSHGDFSLFYVDQLLLCMEMEGDFVCAHAYLLRTWLIYRVVTGSWISMFKFYFFMRVLESMWFTWVTAMNHFPMEIDVDKEDNWVDMQLSATQNIDGSLFNDWFTGHLNYQIEHHFFPTMPRHNYPKIASIIQAFCKKHHRPYRKVSMLSACTGIMRALNQATLSYLNRHPK